MRFPVHEEGGSICRDEAEEMLLTAYRQGVNYFDTAWPYHNGESEPFLGEFVEKHHLRDQIRIATKLPSWLVKKEDDFDSFFQQQLERLRSDSIDLYLLHTLNADSWAQLKDHGVFRFLDRIREQGLAKSVGFSFHDGYSVFEEIIRSYPWDFCQIQYNFLDTNYQAGVEGLKLASDLGIGVVVMEPLRGGSFTKDVPPEIMQIWQKGKGYSPAEWALRYVWDDDRIQVVLSGMSTLQQVEENLRVADSVCPSCLSVEDLERFDRVAAIYERRQKAGCTACRYCMPCPQGVNIPEVLRHYNNGAMFQNMEKASETYRNTIKEKHGAHLCLDCKVCTAHCPQHLPIPQLMREAAQALA